ncbi:trypsin-like peptidase domain-containing protein [Asanoa sp. WMMD1127]|uniref:serine protease n=1 Tax=Asanoa sp. WMMD1127 TaxID=3016107 RepID=UPI002417387D|nr:serine protease [Asanoa sp. WMMD1127]MDG4821531.1 trypsin-like peptidase domain-containing protein [Asanoa sp. WMMD1127]
MRIPPDAGAEARDCAVMVLGADGTFLGSGFFMALRIVVTCAHVVEDAGDTVQVSWGGRIVPARVLVRAPRSRGAGASYPFPDIAFLGVDVLDNRYAHIEPAYLGNDVKQLAVYGFSRWTPEPDPAADSVLVDVIGDSGAYKKVDARHIVPGLSGAPMVDDTGQVRGMLKAGRMRLGESGAMIRGNIILSTYTEHRSVLGEHRRARPPLHRPARGTPLHRMLRAQREVAKRYPYKLAQLTRRAAPPLSTVYVEQRTESWSIGSEPEVIRPAEMLRRHRNVLVVSGPGGGKSTLLLQLVADCAQWWLRDEPAGPDDEPEIGRVVAVRTTAADLLGARSWSDSLALSVNSDLAGFQDGGVTAEMFRTAPARGAEWLVMVDGLDEVIDRDERRRLVEMLAQRVAEYGSEARFVVASRVLDDREFARLRASLGADRLLRLGEYDLRPFDRPALRQFATNWFRPPGGEPSPIEPDEFLDSIRRSGLGTLVQVPLIATIAAVVHEEQPGGELPIDRTGLYEVFVTTLLTQRQQRSTSRQLFLDQLAPLGRGAVEYGDFLFDKRLDCLSHLALERLRGDRRPLLSLAGEWVAAQSTTPPLGVGPGHLRELLLSTGLLVAHGDQLEFIHQSFAEYLASRLIVPDFSSAAWPHRVAEQGLDSLGMFTFAGWVRAGNDSVPVVESILQSAGTRGRPALPAVAGVIEDGGALVRGAGPAVVGLVTQAIRRMGELGDQEAQTLNRALRAVLQRTSNSSIVIDLALDRQLPVPQRIEAARVLMTDGTAADREVGLGSAVDLAYERPMSDEDRLWAQRTLAEVGGPDERPHAVQRMVQTVETSNSEAVRVRALTLLARLGELPAASAALVRRSLDPRLSITERLNALEVLGILVSSADPAEPMAPAGSHAGRIDVDSVIWPEPGGAATPGLAEQLDRFTDAITGALEIVGGLDPASVSPLVELVMRDRSLGWARRVRLASTLRPAHPELAARAMRVLANDREESPANRALSVWLFAEPAEQPAALARLRSWLDDPAQPGELRRAALTQLARLSPAEFAESVAGDGSYPVFLRTAAAQAVADDDRPAALRLLTDLAAELPRWRRLPVLGPRLVVRLQIWGDRMSTLVSDLTRANG